MAKLCFCKEAVFPILMLPMFYILSFVLQRYGSIKSMSSFKVGFCFGIGYFGSSLYWVAESFGCVGLGNYGYIAVVLLVLYLSIYPAIACMLTKIFATTRLNFIMFFSIFWTVMEYLRGLVFTGFPWNLVGYVTYDIPYFAQISDVFGIYGVSFIFVLALLLISYRRTLLAGLVLTVIVMSYGYYKINIYEGYSVPEESHGVTIVQPSIRQEDKMDSRKAVGNINKLILLSNNTSRIHSSKRLIIWPEAAITIPLTNGNNILNYITSNLEGNNYYLVAGADRIVGDGELFNSVCVVDSSGKILQTYDKRHLLPFGEFIPEIFSKIGLKKVTQGMVNFSKGTLSRMIKLDEFEKFSVVVCYEIAFPGEILDSGDSRWILNLTNDSWFKNSDGPTQHLKIACFRAIEEGRAIVRCANNGISCVIDCNGRLLKTLGTDLIGDIKTTMPQKYCSTFFSKHKNKTIFYIMAIMLVAMVCVKKRGRSSSFKFI